MKEQEEQKEQMLALKDFLQALSQSSSGSKKNILRLFLKLSDEQKLICVNSNRALYQAIAKGHGLDLIKHLASLTVPSHLFFAKADVLKKILVGNSKMKFSYQLEILDFIVKYIQDKQIEYDVIHYMKLALDFSLDKVAVEYLRKYEGLLAQTAQNLLDSACKTHFMPECVELLVKSGGILSNEHAKVFGTSAFNKKKYIPKTEALKKLIHCFIEQKIEIPMREEFFFKTLGVPQKEMLVNKLVKGCSAEYWEKLEKVFATIIEVAEFKRNFYLLMVNLDLIQSCYRLHPQKKISRPEKLAGLAVVAIKCRHPLIHVLLQRGLNLNQTVTVDATREKIPPLHLSLAHYVAFYSTDEKLLSELQTVVAVNAFGRNPAHYAALAMPYEFDEKITKRSKQKESKKSLLNPRLEREDLSADVPLDKYYALSQDLFNFDLIGTSRAFKYANLLHNGLVEDLFGFTPLDYVLIQVDQTKRKQMLEAFNKLFLPFIGNILNNFPTVLLPVIMSYLIDECADPDLLAISWGKELIFKKNCFAEDFQKYFINSVKEYFDDKNQFIGNKFHIRDIRNAIYIFTILSLREGDYFAASNQILKKNKNTIFAKQLFLLHTADSKSQSYPQLSSSQRHLPPPVTGPLGSSSSSHYRFTSCFRSNLSGGSIFCPDWSYSDFNDLKFSSSSNSSSSSSAEIEPKKKNKRSRSTERLFQPFIASWKEERDSLIEKLEQCYTSGSRIKPDLEKALSPFIKQLEQAKNEEELRRCMELINDTLDISGNPLQVAVDKYDFREFMENLFNPCRQNREVERCEF